MKKIVPVLLSATMVFSLVSPFAIQAKTKPLPKDHTIRLVDAKDDATYEVIKNASSYSEAKKEYTKLKSKYDNLGIALGDDVLMIENGVVAFETNNACTITVSYTNDANGQDGYTNGCYGGDAAFIDYNHDTKQVKFQLSGVTAWAPLEKVDIHPVNALPNVSSFKVHNGILHHLLKSDAFAQHFENDLRLSKAPAYLKEDQTYYSYDSHYFYETFEAMIEDLRKETHAHAVNAKYPYYKYYQYVSHRSTTNYSYEDVHKYLNEKRGFTDTIINFEDYDNFVHDNLSESIIMQGDQAFFHYQNQFGVNAIMMLSLALNESASGRSVLAYNRNNLFGHAAFDNAVDKNASRYQKVSDSIYSHALHYISSSYLDADAFQYHGGHFGNKAGGLNVSYASDPYWGEKAAQYYFDMDEAMGSKDENQYAFGITGAKQATIKKDASAKSKTLYTIPKGIETSLVLLDKKEAEGTTWYLVQSEKAIDAKGNATDGKNYNLTTSKGYVKASDLQAIVNKDSVKAKPYHSITFDANGGKFYPSNDKVTLEVVDKMLPVALAPEKANALFTGWDKEVVAADKDATYKAVYKDVKEIHFTKEPQKQYQIDDTLNLEGAKLEVIFKDGSKQETTLTTDMVQGFDSSKTGKKTMKITYAGKTINFPIQVVKEIKTEQARLQKEAADIIAKYSNGVDASAYPQLEKFQKDLLALGKRTLSNDVLRATDRILQPVLGPRMSVVIKDDQYNLQASGLSVNFQKNPEKLHDIMPKTLIVELSHQVDEKTENLYKTVIDANYMRFEDTFTIDGKNDFDAFEPETEILYSLKKPEGSENKLFRVLAIEDGKVIQLPTSQSETRILFQAKKGNFALASIAVPGIKGAPDYTEVATIAGNGKNYIQSYIVMPAIIGSIALVVIIAGVIIFVIKRKKAKASNDTLPPIQG